MLSFMYVDCVEANCIALVRDLAGISLAFTIVL